MKINFGYSQPSKCMVANPKTDSLLIYEIKEVVNFGTKVDDNNYFKPALAELCFHNTKSIDAMIRLLEYLKETMTEKQLFSAC